MCSTVTTMAMDLLQYLPSSQGLISCSCDTLKLPSAKDNYFCFDFCLCFLEQGSSLGLLVVTSSTEEPWVLHPWLCHACD